MKITESGLRRIIRQEAQALREGPGGTISTNSIRSLDKQLVSDWRELMDATEAEWLESARQEMEALVPPGSKVRVATGRSSKAGSTVGTVVEVQARMSEKFGPRPEFLIVVDYVTGTGRPSQKAFKLNELDPYTADWFT